MWTLGYERRGTCVSVCICASEREKLHHICMYHPYHSLQGVIAREGGEEEVERKGSVYLAGRSTSRKGKGGHLICRLL